MFFAMLEADHFELIYLPETGLCVLKFNTKIYIKKIKKNKDLVLPESTDHLHGVQLWQTVKWMKLMMFSDPILFKPWFMHAFLCPQAQLASLPVSGSWPRFTVWSKWTDPSQCNTDSLRSWNDFEVTAPLELLALSNWRENCSVNPDLLFRLGQRRLCL